MSKKLTYEFVKNYIESFEEYKLLSKEYKNSNSKLIVKHLICGIEYEVPLNNFKSGERCPACFGKHKHSYEYVKSYIESYGYKLLSTNYINVKNKLKVQCPKEHIYYVNFNNFRTGKRCKLCSIVNKANKKDYIKSFIESCGFKWISGEYKNRHSILEIECNKNHRFKIKWVSFIQRKSCLVCSYKYGEDNHSYKGGVTKKDLPLYDTFYNKLQLYEEVRRDPEDNRILQVKCKNSSCRKWFTPSRIVVDKRIRALNKTGGNNFYCSEECKQSCSIYGQKLYPKGFKSNEQQRNPEWSEMVKQRDNYTCQICGSTENLVAHHVESLFTNPIESADLDLGITVCKDCHKKLHSDINCNFINLTKTQLCKEVKNDTSSK